jgi:putative transposase
MLERGVHVDHSTINRWVVKYSPLLEEAFHRRKRPVWVSWRMDETYIKVKGQWYYLYRAVDKTGQTIDFLLTEQRDEHAAKRASITASATFGRSASPHNVLVGIS